MQNIFAIWHSLFTCLAIIGMAGDRLSRHGDIIAEKSGLSSLLRVVTHLLNSLITLPV